MAFKIKKEKLNLPELSIIIPVKDQIQYLDKCLASLQKVEGVNFEVIISNDGSGPEVVQYLEQFPQLNVIHSSQSEGFITACHKGVQRSVGKYLLFLNSDTELIEPLSFRKMLDCFEYNKNIGVVGAKLLYPNNTVQHFGLVWDSKQMNYVHFAIGKDKNDPIVCTSQPFDVISGACFMVSRELWNKIGGFDKIYSPGYFEDTNFCLVVKELGYTNICCSEAVLYHAQSKSFTGGPTKDHFSRNHEIFKSRWIRTGKVCKYPKIAACYITKNEEEYIEYSVKSIYPLVSKIIVVDNNSTDKTLEILERMEDPQKKITVISREFKNKTDQRNVYCGMLQGYDFAFILDADEVFDNENLRRIEHLIFGNPEIPAFCLNFVDFWKDMGNVSKGIWETFTGRKSLINLNLTGRIKYNTHTLPVLFDGGDIPAVFCQDIKFFHYSYVRSNERIKDKIDYYVKTGTPGFQQQQDWYNSIWLAWDNNKEEVEKKGTHLFGGGTTELFTGEHPEVMHTHPRYMEYLDKYKLKINLSVFPIQRDNFQNITLKNHNIFDMKFDNRPYIVLVEDILESISFNAIGELLIRVYDLMEINGEIVIKTPHLINVIKKYLNNEIQYVDFIKIMYGEQVDSIDYHACLYEPSSIKALLEDVGFSNVNISEIDDGFNMYIVGKKYKELKNS